MMRLSVVLSLFLTSLTIVNGWSNLQAKQHITARRELFSKIAGSALIVSGNFAITPKLAIAVSSPEIFTTPNGIKFATIKKATSKGSPIDKDIVAIEYTGYLTDGTIFGMYRTNLLDNENIFPVGLTFLTILHELIDVSDATHAEGKQVCNAGITLKACKSWPSTSQNSTINYPAALILQKALVFELGGNAVIEGINEMVRKMEVGQKVQAIIPPTLAFGDKGICIENGECLGHPVNVTKSVWKDVLQ
jgi:FKBP-type peptidyl-prolyl cis-trans isomerase 2